MQRFQIINGSTRTVLLIGKYAFKLPYFFSYKNFLLGLLANIQEVSFNKIRDIRLAPVLFSLPLGLLVVMPRVNPIQNYDKKKLIQFCSEKNGFKIPCELKIDSFGMLNNKLVVIDYGN